MNVLHINKPKDTKRQKKKDARLSSITVWADFLRWYFFLVNPDSQPFDGKMVHIEEYTPQEWNWLYMRKLRLFNPYFLAITNASENWLIAPLDPGLIANDI